MRWIRLAATVVLVASAAPAISQPLASKPSCDREVRQILAERAKGGDRRAQYWVGIALETGECGQKDIDGAADWLLESAQQGFPPALYALGVILRREGEPRMALALFDRAARSGYRSAEAEMALSLSDPESPARDDVLAYGWLSLAASRDQLPEVTALLRRSLARIEQSLSADSRQRAEAVKARIAAEFASIETWKDE